MKFNFSLLGAALLGAAGLQAADTVYSGPQPGEKTTPFKTWAVTGNSEGKERDPVAENAGAPTALVFIHTVERSLLPLLRAVDQYGFERKDLLKTEVIFLYGDRLEGEQRVKTVTRSLQLHSQSSLSLDGAEGPGNYGLNKECMMTIIAAKDNKVTASFALVQPGIADAPRVLEALAKTCGDTNPPPIERLTAGGTGRVAPDRAMQRDGAAARRGATNQATAKAAEGPAPAAAAAAGDALTDGAQVIGIDARARKQKGSLAAGAPALTTTRSRPGRRLATKVAACIIALLAAATLLAVVDRAALGSVPQPTWLPPLPSYAPAVVNWSLLGPKPATGQSDPADPADAGVARPRPFAHENPLLRRYLEIWPAGS